MVTPNHLSLRNPRVRALTPILNRRLGNYLRTHLPYLTILHAVNDRSIRPIPNILLIFLPLLENLLETFLSALPHLANPLITLLLNPFLASPPNLATRALSLRLRAPYIHNSATARSQGADIPLPTSTFLPLLNPRSRIPNNPLPRSPFSTTLHLVSPELTLVRRASSLLRNRLIQLPSSSPVSLGRARRTKPLSRDR